MWAMVEIKSHTTQMSMIIISKNYCDCCHCCIKCQDSRSPGEITQVKHPIVYRLYVRMLTSINSCIIIFVFVVHVLESLFSILWSCFFSPSGLYQTVPQEDRHVHWGAASYHLWQHWGDLPIPEEVPERSGEEVQQRAAAPQRDWLLLSRTCKQCEQFHSSNVSAHYFYPV